MTWSWTRGTNSRQTIRGDAIARRAIDQRISACKDVGGASKSFDGREFRRGLSRGSTNGSYRVDQQERTGVLVEQLVACAVRWRVSGAAGRRLTQSSLAQGPAPRELDGLDYEPRQIVGSGVRETVQRQDEVMGDASLASERSRRGKTYGRAGGAGPGESYAGELGEGDSGRGLRGSDERRGRARTAGDAEVSRACTRR